MVALSVFVKVFECFCSISSLINGRIAAIVSLAIRRDKSTPGHPRALLPRPTSRRTPFQLRIRSRFSLFDRTYRRTFGF